MTERPSQNKQILSILEQVLTKVSKIETQIEMTPQIYEEKFKAITLAQVNCKENCVGRIGNLESDMEELKSKPTKRLDMIIGAVIGSAIGVISSLIASNAFKW